MHQRAVAVAVEILVQRQVEAATAADRAAVGEVGQARAAAVAGADVEVASTDGALLVEGQAGGSLVGAPAQLVLAVQGAEVAIAGAALDVLQAEAEPSRIVGVAEQVLLAAVALAVAAAGRQAEGAEGGHGDVAADAEQAQVAGGLGVGGEGQAVADAVAVDAAGGVVGIGKVAQAVVVAQAPDGQVEIAQAARQQGVGYVERQAGHHLSALGVGGHHRGFAGSVDIRHVADGEGTGLQVGAAGLVAVDEQVDGAGYGGLAVEAQQRIGDQVRTYAEVAGEAKAAHAYRGGPVQRAVDVVAQLVAVHVAFVVVQPVGVVAQVAAVEVVGVAEIAGVDAGVGDHPEAVEQTLLEQRGKPGRGAVGGVRVVQVVVEQRAEAAARRGAGDQSGIVEALLRQPVRRHLQVQLLAGAVIVRPDLGQGVHRDLSGGVARQAHAGFAQGRGVEQVMAIGGVDRHHLAAVAAVDHQFQVVRTLPPPDGAGCGGGSPAR